MIDPSRYIKYVGNRCRRGAPRYRGEIESSPEAVRRLVARLDGLGEQLKYRPSWECSTPVVVRLNRVASAAARSGPRVPAARRSPRVVIEIHHQRRRGGQLHQQPTRQRAQAATLVYSPMGRASPHPACRRATVRVT